MGIIFAVIVVRFASFLLLLLHWCLTEMNWTFGSFGDHWSKGKGVPYLIQAGADLQLLRHAGTQVACTINLE